MTTSIKSSSSFLTRPFDGIEVFASSLDAAILKLGEEEVYYPGAIELPTNQLPLSDGQVEIYFAPSLIEDLKNQKIEPKTVELVCFIQGTVIAESQIIFQVNIADAVSPVVVHLQGNPLILQSPNGFDVRIALILSKDRIEQHTLSIIFGNSFTRKFFQVQPFSKQKTNIFVIF